MNYELPIYREAHKLFEGMPSEHWSVIWVLERYVNGAISQLDRIRRTLDQGGGYNGTWLLDQIGLDVHSYFICWDKAQNLLRQLVRVHPNAELAKIWAEFEPICRPFNDARNHLEHIDERLARDPRNTGAVQGDFFVIAGERFDVSQAGLKLLTDMYEEVINIITLRINGRQPSLEEYRQLDFKPTIRREAMERRPRNP
jgi:hypothetical protein